MNIQNKKQYTIAFFLLLTITVSLFTLSNTKAQQTGIKTYPFVEAIPNQIGVNQTTLINFGLLNSLVKDNDGWNVTLTITSPDNETEIIGPLKTYSNGKISYSYTPHRTEHTICRHALKQHGIITNTTTYKSTDTTTPVKAKNTN